MSQLVISKAEKKCYMRMLIDEVDLIGPPALTSLKQKNAKDWLQAFNFYNINKIK